jgi:RimJ/RimL family protein N-acetyltransferase
MERTYIAVFGNLKARKTTGADIDRVMAMERHSENADFVLQWSHEKHLELIADDFWGHWILEASDDGRMVGYAILRGVNRADRILQFNRLVIAEKGKGFGRDAIRLVKKYAFEQLKVHRLWFDVFADNDRAVALYRSEGFAQDALLRDHEYHGGRYRSQMIFSMLEHEYIPR